MSCSGSRAGARRNRRCDESRTRSLRLPQLLEHHRIDRIFAVDPLLEILDSCPIREPLVAEGRESPLDLRAQLLVDGNPLVARCRAEQQRMEVIQAPELLD